MKNIFLILFIIFPFIAFSQEIKKFEYLTISNNINYYQLKIESSTYVKFIQYGEEIKKDGYQFNRLLQLVEQYEMEGWSLFSYTPIAPANSKILERALMRREKATENEE